MSGTRLASAIVSVVLAILLVLAVVPAFGPAEVVRPTGGVIDGPRDDLPSLEQSRQALRTRTFLQEWRGVSGPAPNAAIESPVVTHRGDDAPDPVPGEDQ